MTHSQYELKEEAMGIKSPSRRSAAIWQALKSFKQAHYHTKIFILMGVIYMLALMWTTSQAFLRLIYGHSDLHSPTVIQIPPQKPNE
jgi:hypothetical protein